MHNIHNTAYCITAQLRYNVASPYKRSKFRKMNDSERSSLNWIVCTLGITRYFVLYARHLSTKCRLLWVHPASEEIENVIMFRWYVPRTYSTSAFIPERDQCIFKPLPPYLALQLSCRISLLISQPWMLKRFRVYSTSQRCESNVVIENDRRPPQESSTMILHLHKYWPMHLAIPIILIFDSFRIQNSIKRVRRFIIISYSIRRGEELSGRDGPFSAECATSAAVWVLNLHIPTTCWDKSSVNSRISDKMPTRAYLEEYFIHPCVVTS